MSIPIRFALLRRQPSVGHPFQPDLTTLKLLKLGRSPRVRIERSFLTAEQNRDTDERKANNNHRCARNPAISPGILRPFSAYQEEESDQKKIGDAQREMRLRKNEEWNCRRQTRYKDQHETGERAVKVVFRHAGFRDPRLRYVIKNGSAESFTLLGI